MAGCGGVNVGERGGDADSMGGIPVAEQEIATVSAAGVEVTFLAEFEPDHPPTIALREQGSVNATTSPVLQLMAQRLTSLEMYLTLAPGQNQAPLLLRQAHDAEAAALGRDALVRVGSLEASPIVEKDLASKYQACKTSVLLDFDVINSLLPTPGNSIGGLNGTLDEFTSGSHHQFVGGASNYATTNVVGLGVCNGSNDTVKASYAYDQRWNGLGWQNGTPIALGSAGFARWFFRFSWTSGGVTRGASYRVNGSSPGLFFLTTREFVRS